MRAQNSNVRGFVTSYKRQATSQSSSVGVNTSLIETSTSCNWKKKNGILEQTSIVATKCLLNEKISSLCTSIIRQKKNYIMYINK